MQQQMGSSNELGRALYCLQRRVRRVFFQDVSLAGRADRVIETPYEGNGYHYEAAEVMRCLRAGKWESDIMPLEESLRIMKTLDEIRNLWGLKYPVEFDDDQPVDGPDGASQHRGVGFVCGRRIYPIAPAPDALPSSRRFLKGLHIGPCVCRRLPLRQ